MDPYANQPREWMPGHEAIAYVCAALGIADENRAKLAFARQASNGAVRTRGTLPDDPETWVAIPREGWKDTPYLLRYTGLVVRGYVHVEVSAEDLPLVFPINASVEADAAIERGRPPIYDQASWAGEALRLVWLRGSPKTPVRELTRWARLSKASRGPRRHSCVTGRRSGWRH
jgi:hypothetical protein